MTEQQFDWQPLENFDHATVAALMRDPSIYWQSTDAMAPPPEQIDFEAFMAQPDAFTVAASYRGIIFGFVYLLRRTSIGAELHCGFHPNFRGKVAKAFCQWTILKGWERGLKKIWTIVPADNRPAIVMARACGFEPEARLKNAIVRSSVLVRSREPEGPKLVWAPSPGLRDLVILSQFAPVRGN